MTSGSPPHDPTRILTVPEIAEATRELRKLMARDFPIVPADLFGNLDHMVRLMSLNARFKQAREASGRTIKQIAAEIKVPQYRLKAIEKGRLLDVDGTILARYGASLGLDEWLAVWAAANGHLAAELGIGPPVGEVALAVSVEAEPAAAPAPADAPKLTLVRSVRAARAWKPQLVYRFRVTLQEVAAHGATRSFWPRSRIRRTTSTRGRWNGASGCSIPRNSRRLMSCSMIRLSGCVGCNGTGSVGGGLCCSVRSSMSAVREDPGRRPSSKR